MRPEIVSQDKADWALQGCLSHPVTEVYNHAFYNRHHMINNNVNLKKEMQTEEMQRREMQE